MKNILYSIIALFSLSFLLLIFRIPLKNSIANLMIKKQIVNELDSDDSVRQIMSQSGEFNYQSKTGYYEGKKFTLPDSLALLPANQNVLGWQAFAAEGEKVIEIDLTNQKLYAKEGGNVVYEMNTSSGMPWTPTVTGEFRIWSKMKYTRMAGGCDIGDCYDLPNVPYTQYFYKGYALHGAYWHNDFGRPKSHGCVNLSIPDAEKLYYWANPTPAENGGIVYPTKDNPGTKVIIYGQAHL